MGPTCRFVGLLVIDLYTKATWGTSFIHKCTRNSTNNREEQGARRQEPHRWPRFYRAWARHRLTATVVAGLHLPIVKHTPQYPRRMVRPNHWRRHQVSPPPVGFGRPTTCIAHRGWWRTLPVAMLFPVFIMGCPPILTRNRRQEASSRT